MTAHEYDLAVRAVIGLAGCAVALAAYADWRQQVISGTTYWTTNSSSRTGWRSGEKDD